MPWDRLSTRGPKADRRFERTQPANQPERIGPPDLCSVSNVSYVIPGIITANHEAARRSEKNLRRNLDEYNVFRRSAERKTFSAPRSGRIQAQQDKGRA